MLQFKERRHKENRTLAGQCLQSETFSIQSKLLVISANPSSV